MHKLLLALVCMLASLTATAASAPERMLIFSKTAGFRHESIPTAVATLRQLAAEEGMAADHSEDVDVFTADNLARYRVVAFASTTGEILAPAQQQAFEGYIRKGGGFLGVHSAADTGYQWPWYGQLVGAWFKGHPPGLQSTRVQPEREGQAVGKGWPITDEIYNYRNNPRGQVQVVATVDERLYAGGTMGADHPIAWCHGFDGGRAWYTGLGHDAAVYANADFLAQLRQGLRYAAGHVPGC
ncbi:ThuA domain-containing protein [Xanthomonas vesicatoria]|uniref:Crp/Fnr family transcriptional regulator n=1 Tax=Xanthomonas vesicatoria TaxID=56460 RepID=A0AAJ0IWX0_9XANT|nr:ThuA domain-containing protein [Xanthomonas vesicatoria]APO97380.1 Crp/Fnr family transcriptional regulator [Xanthomonas vesicatoria]KHM92759.1 Crp/Fnr family transcriptional regulator [Xanthomonas vesicatoria]KHM94128.1 Crp/Fnr family transcriptional regulator [Xanthomonas vesicatoria]MCC8624273.1 ThuA domain-containing protein [Xanthomonas vesicatoria]MCC8625051.1 ThuA domain-containing protein [Xanthomonas vesicatoria]